MYSQPYHNHDHSSIYFVRFAENPSDGDYVEVRIFFENVAFFEKIDETIFKISFPMKNVSPDAPFPSKGTWPPEPVFLRWKVQFFFFLKKLFNNKIFST